MIVGRLLSGVVLGVVAQHCASPRGADPSPRLIEPGVIGEHAVTDAELVEQISVAPCEHGQSCGRIGPGRTYRDGSECMNQMRVRIV